MRETMCKIFRISQLNKMRENKRFTNFTKEIVKTHLDLN